MNARTQAYPKCNLLPTLPASSITRDVKENMIQRTRPPPTAPCSSSGAHVPIVSAFSGGQGSAWELWHATSCGALCVLTVSIITLRFSAIPATVALLMSLDNTSQPLLPMLIKEPVHRLPFLGPLLIGTNHFLPGASLQICCLFWPRHLAIRIWPLSKSLGRRIELRSTQTSKSTLPPYACPFFLLVTSLSRIDCSLAAQYIPLLTGTIVTR